MKLPEYVTTEEVKRVCKEIGLRDWSEITAPTVSEEEASAILEIVNTKSLVHLTTGSTRRREGRRPYAGKFIGAAGYPERKKIQKNKSLNLSV